MSLSVESSTHVVDVLQALWRWRILLAISAVASGAVFAAYAWLAHPIYKVDAVLIVAQSQDQAGSLGPLLGQLGGLASLAGGMLNTGAEADEAIAVLKSRSIGEQFIRDNNLLQTIFAARWDSVGRRWRPSRFSTDPTIQDAYKIFDARIRSVSVDQKSGLITLSMRWTDPAQAAAWTATLIKLVNAKMKEAEIVEARKSLDFLNQELRKTNVLEIQQAIYRLVEVQTRRIMLANVRDEFAFRVIDAPIVPDLNKFESPNRSLLTVLGIVLGFLGGSFLVLSHQAYLTLRSTLKSVDS